MLNNQCTDTPITKSSKIYIAGHKGLVGSAILKNLQKKGYTNFITRTHEELDLIRQYAVEEFFDKQKPEYVILAAAKVGGIVANNTYRADFIYENLAVQNNVIHQSYLHRVKKLLFLGSSCIYPKEAPQPMKEESLLTSQLEYTNEPYAIAKIAGVKMCESYNLQYGTNFIAVMPTNLYGKNDNFDLKTSHVLPALLRKIYLAKLLNEKRYDEVIKDLQVKTKEQAMEYLSIFGVDKNQVEIWGSGKPRREFMYNEDMADACVYILENVDWCSGYWCNGNQITQPTNNQYTNYKSTNNQYTNQPPTNTHINIGTGKDISIKELAELLKDMVGFKGKLVFNQNKPDGTMLKLTDTTRLNSLGWAHRVELEEGVRRVYEWYKNKNDIKI